MKKKILIILIIILVMVGVFFLGRQVGLNEEQGSKKTVKTEEKVSTQTIKKTLTSSGSVESKATEKPELNTTKYFEAMCVEVDDTVSAGDKILKYTDGTYLEATNNGVIISTNLPETGSICTSSNYVEISSLDSLIISLSISENEIANIKEDQEVEISLTADETKTFSGKITKIDSVGTYSTSGTTFSAIVEFENDGSVKLGMSVSCTVTIKEEKDVISVPVEAVATNSEGEKYVIKINSEGKEEETIVETGIANENYIQIISGLTVDDTVQIETEITEDANTSSQKSNNGFGEKGQMGGEMPERSGERQNGNFDRSQFQGGEPPSKPTE